MQDVEGIFAEMDAVFGVSVHILGECFNLELMLGVRPAFIRCADQEFRFLMGSQGERYEKILGKLT